MDTSQLTVPQGGLVKMVNYVIRKTGKMWQDAQLYYRKDISRQSDTMLGRCGKMLSYTIGRQSDTLLGRCSKMLSYTIGKTCQDNNKDACHGEETARP